METPAPVTYVPDPEAQEILKKYSADRARLAGLAKAREVRAQNKVSRDGENWRQRAKRISQERRAQRVMKNGHLVHPDAPHGTSIGVKSYGCSCDACRGWATGKSREYRKNGAKK